MLYELQKLHAMFSLLAFYLFVCQRFWRCMPPKGQAATCPVDWMPKLEWRAWFRIRGCRRANADIARICCKGERPTAYQRFRIETVAGDHRRILAGTKLLPPQPFDSTPNNCSVDQDALQHNRTQCISISWYDFRYRLVIWLHLRGKCDRRKAPVVRRSRCAPSRWGCRNRDPIAASRKWRSSRPPLRLPVVREIHLIFIDLL